MVEVLINSIRRLHIYLYLEEANMFALQKGRLCFVFISHSVVHIGHV